MSSVQGPRRLRCTSKVRLLLRGGAGRALCEGQLEKWGRHHVDRSGVHPWLLLGQVHEPVSWVKKMCFYGLRETRLGKERWTKVHGR